MLMIIMEIYGVKIKDTLVDGGSKVNINTESLQIKLCLGGMEPLPFQVKVAYQRWLHPLGILKDLPIKIEGVDFRVTIIVLQMEGGSEEYSLLLGCPWLPETKDHHN